MEGFYYKGELFPTGKLENLKTFFPQITKILDEKAEKKYLSVKVKIGTKTKWVYLEPEFFFGRDSKKTGQPSKVLPEFPGTPKPRASSNSKSNDDDKD